MHWNKLKDWEKAIFVALLVLAIFTRFYILGDRVMSHDESLHTKFSWYLYAGQGYTHNPMMHGPLLFHLTALAYFLLGVNDFTARFFPALCGVILVMTPYLFRRWLGKGGTIAAAVLLLLSPSISYYSRYIRHDVFNILAAVLLLWAILRYLDTFAGAQPENDDGDRWLYALAVFFALLFTTKETSYIYTAIFGLILAVPFLWQILTTHWAQPHFRAPFILVLVATLVLAGVFAFSLMGAQVQETALDDNTSMAAAVIPLWGKIAAALALAAFIATAMLVLFGMGEKSLRRIPLFNLLMVLGTLTLPLGAAVFIHLSDVDMLALASTLASGTLSQVLDSLGSDLAVSIIITLMVLGSSVLIGLWWDARRWPIIAAIHYGILFLFYTTFFTNPLGVFGGLVGSLAYWMGQQEVARGTQPIYYYLLWMPLYEYLPLLFSVGGGIGAVIYAFSSRAPREEGAEEPARPAPTLHLTRFFPLALLVWTVLAWLLYTLAGERMPWLTVHIALPSIFLAAWGLGQLLDGLDWETLTRWPGAAGWLAPVALPLTLVGLVVFATSVSGITAILQEGASPAGFSLIQLQSFGQGIGGLIGFGISLAAFIWAVRQVGEGQAVRLATLTLALCLALLTVHTMVTLNFVNYDMATEFLVYAHGAPDVKVALQQIEDISWRTTGTPHDIKVAYDDNCSWPFSWYMVPYPNAYYYGSSPTPETLLECPVIIAGEWADVDAILAQDYLHFDYIFRWWPIEDYKGLTWEQARSMLADPAMRAALWDIIWSRDYRKYAEVTEKTITLHKWPHRSEFRLYVRRNLASEVWGYRLGAEGVQSEFPTVEATVMPDLYAGHALPVSLAETVALPGAVPRGLAVAADGSLYVADTANHRIWHVNRQGAVLGSWGEQGTGPAQFQEPWGLALDDQGNVYVADTWNHRVQKFDAQGNFLLDWGAVGQFAPGDPNGAGVFFGPRGIAIGPEGHVYVTDTGNKRVQVFDDQGNFLWEFGGQLNEPVGIAISAAGEVFVADTWNRRVQVFSTQGEPLRQWNVPTWYLHDLEEKPYLALDGEDNLYVTDGGHARVLVFDKDGAFLGSVGEGQGLLFPAGVATSADGWLYVTDAHSGRALGWTLNADR